MRNVTLYGFLKAAVMLPFLPSTAATWMLIHIIRAHPQIVIGSCVSQTARVVPGDNTSDTLVT